MNSNTSMSKIFFQFLMNYVAGKIILEYIANDHVIVKIMVKAKCNIATASVLDRRIKPLFIILSNQAKDFFCCFFFNKLTMLKV